MLKYDLEGYETHLNPPPPKKKKTNKKKQNKNKPTIK